MYDEADERTGGAGGAPEPGPVRGWISFGLPPLDGRLPGTEGDPALQAQLAEAARLWRDPEWRARFEAQAAPWRASIARGEAAAALVAGPLPHGADALVVRDPAASEPRLLVLSEGACTDARIARVRDALVQSEIRALDVPRRVELALWLDGRAREEDADGRVRMWTDDWHYFGGANPEGVRDFLDRFEGAPHIVLPGLGPARVAPGYPYPRDPRRPPARGP